MRILITSIVDLKKTSHNRLHEFVGHLGRKHDVSILSVNDFWKASQTNTALYLQGFEEILQNINIGYFSQRKMSPILQEITSMVTASKLLDKVDWRKIDVHLNYNSLLSGYFVTRRMKSIGVETIYDIADDLPAMAGTSLQIPFLLRPLARTIAKIMTRRNVIMAEKIMVSTRALQTSLGIPSTKSELVPNGVDTQLFASRPSSPLKEQLGLGLSFTLGFVGVLREWVNLEPVFAAMRELSGNGFNIKMLIIGGEWGLTKNMALAQSYGISDKIIFTGTVPYRQVPQYIACMDTCLIPFKNNAVSQNALALKLFEYMACEKPVISTKLAGINEVMGSRIMYASNREEYCEVIATLYKDGGLRQEMGMAGREFVERNYSWSTNTSKLEKVLEKAGRTKKLKSP